MAQACFGTSCRFAAVLLIALWPTRTAPFAHAPGQSIGWLSVSFDSKDRCHLRTSFNRLHATVSPLRPAFQITVHPRRRCGIGELRMGRVGGKSGISRTVESNKPGKRSNKAMARPPPPYEGSTGKRKKKGRHPPPNGPRLAIFGFDGTLFRSPLHHFPLGCSLQAGKGGLYPPVVPWTPGDDWFSARICAIAEEKMLDPQYSLVLVSGRPESCRERIEEILFAKGLLFDDIVLRPETLSGPTSRFKQQAVERLQSDAADKAEVTVAVQVWDDDVLCIDALAGIPYVDGTLVTPRWGPPMEMEHGDGDGAPMVTASSAWGREQRGVWRDRTCQLDAHTVAEDTVLGVEEEEEEGDDEEEEELRSNAESFCYALAQGRRPYMEDIAVAIPDLQVAYQDYISDPTHSTAQTDFITPDGTPVCESRDLHDARVGECCQWRRAAEDGGGRLALYGLFDGHAGVEAAEFGARRLWVHLCLGLSRGMEAASALHRAFIDTDAELYAWLCSRGKKHMNLEVGSTAVVALLSDQHIIVANAGDSQCFLISDDEDSEPQHLTALHRPSEPKERARIEANGGEVKMVGVPRVNGVLAVSRGLGDFGLKEVTTAVPHVTTVPRCDSHRFLVLASDGLWDVMEAREVADTLRGSSLKAGARAIVDSALSDGTNDNVGAIVVSGLHRQRESRGTRDVVKNTEVGVNVAR